MASNFTGKKHSEETKRKISESLKGRTISEELRKKLSSSRKGIIQKFIPDNKGRVFTEEHKLKLSLAKKKLWEGKKKTDEQKKEYQRQYRKDHREKLKVKNEKFFTKDNGLYKTFRCILQRCNNKNHKHYKNYGGRGIKCFWENYEQFKSDMYESYLKHFTIHGRKDTTIERIDVNGHYNPQNCCWATMSEQSRNKRKKV